MPVRPRAWAFPVLAVALPAMLIAGPSGAAAPDDNIEWNGISHVGWQDRRPLCPVGGESFQVRFQTWANDLTSARVRVDAGASSWVDAARVGTRGPYDVWVATVPATGSATESYWIELTDGTDTDYVSPAGLSDDAPASGWVLDFTTLEHAPIGATRTSGGGAVFKVWAPTRTSAHVRGEFNAWGLGNPMTKVGEHFIALVPAVGDRQVDDRERRLQRRELEELVEDHLRVLALLELDHQADPVAVGLVAQVGDAGEAVALLHQLDDLLDDRRLAYLVRDLGEDDLFLGAHLLDLVPRAHHAAPAPRAVGAHDV